MMIASWEDIYLIKFIFYYWAAENGIKNLYKTAFVK